MRFTMDGCADLEALTDELSDEGIQIGCTTREQLRGTIAAVLRIALQAADEGSDRAWELFAGMSGVVSCAEEEGLI